MCTLRALRAVLRAASHSLALDFVPFRQPNRIVSKSADAWKKPFANGRGTFARVGRDSSPQARGRGKFQKNPREIPKITFVSRDSKSAIRSRKQDVSDDLLVEIRR